MPRITPRRVGACIALVATCTLPAPALAVTPPSWLSFDEPVATGPTTAVTGADLAPDGRTAIVYRKGTGALEIAERAGGQGTFTRRVVTSPAPGFSAVVVERDRTTVAWADSAGVHVRDRVDDGELGPVEDLGGSSAAMQMVRLTDGSVVVAQAADEAVRVWRRAPGAKAFDVLPDVAVTDHPTGFVLRAGVSGGAVLGVATRAVSTAPDQTVTTTLTPRAAWLHPDKDAFGSAEQAGDPVVHVRGASSRESETLDIEDALLARDGTPYLAFRVTYDQILSGGRLRTWVHVSRRAAGGQWGTSRPLAEIDSLQGLPGGIDRMRLAPAGDDALALWSMKPSGGRPPFGNPPLLQLARSATDWDTPDTLVVGRASETVILLGAATRQDGRTLTFVRRDNALRAMTLDPKGPVIDMQTVPGSGAPRLVVPATDADTTLIVTTRQGTDGTWTHAASLLDDTAPVIESVDVPATASVGEPVALSAAAIDHDRADVEWHLGDGRSVHGATVETTFDTPGRRTITVTASDRSGNVTVQERTIDVAETPARN